MLPRVLGGSVRRTIVLGHRAFRAAIAVRLCEVKTTFDSTARLEPGDDLWPYPCVGGTPDEHSHMRQPDADFAGMLDDSGILGGPSFNEWCNGGQWCNFVNRIDDRKRGNRHAGGPHGHVQDHEGPLIEEALPLNPHDHTSDHRARQHDYHGGAFTQTR